MHQHFVSRLHSVITVATVVMSMSVVALPSAQRSQTEGIKEAEKFVNTGADTASAVSKARLQVQATLAAYNALVTQASTNMKGDYKKLLNGAKDMAQKVDGARERITKMQAAGEHGTSRGAPPPSRRSRTQICGRKGSNGSTRTSRSTPA